MKRFAFSLFAVVSLLLLAGCGSGYEPQTGSLVDARKGFNTVIVRQIEDHDPVETPPQGVFEIVRYDSPLGPLPAYLTVDPKDGKKHPAIVWITGGDCNSIGDVWSPATPDDDQTASAYREAGIVMMFPSMRGGNQNPGIREGYLREADDVLAAADFLAKREWVDPSRIYLGGHSSGGTLVMLVAESSPRFRATFSFGPVADVRCYPPEYVPFDASIRREWELRAPALWLHCIESPVFVFEGGDGGNCQSLDIFQELSTNSNLHVYRVDGTSHFSVLAPVNRLLAQKVLGDTGPTCNIAITDDELRTAVGR
jgi:dienelactone hydrolase